MRSDYLHSVAVYFNVSTDYLLGREQKSLSPKLSEDKLRLLNMYDLLTDREQGEILGEMKALTKGRESQENAG